MNGMSSELPGLERIRARFVSLLAERQLLIAQHALAAWESDSSAEQCANLREAQNVLHQIVGSAGSLGFAELGQVARACEGMIITHIENAGPADGALPINILADLDAFVSMSQALIAKSK